MIEFNSEITLNEIINYNKSVIVIYHAKWCLPCKGILQTFATLESQLDNTLKIITVNVDNYPNIALELNVRAIPTIKYYKNGALYLKESGFRTTDQLLRNVNALLSINCIV
jgi:thioredoxin 1